MKKLENAIIVWEYADAPEYLKKLSNNGGDEDWIAEVPPKFEYPPSWIESRSFGCCDVQVEEHPLKPGYKIYIGSHA